MGSNNYSDSTLILCRPDWFKQVAADLKRHEGFREFAYPDPLSSASRMHRKEKWGFEPARPILVRLGLTEREGAPWTIGYGFTGGVTPDSRMTVSQADRRLEAEIEKRVPDLNSLIPGWQDLPVFASSVLMNMDYNMGKESFSHFAPTLTLFKEHEYKLAGERLTTSRWYSQVGDRGKELVARLVNGRVEPQHDVNKLTS